MDRHNEKIAENLKFLKTRFVNRLLIGFLAPSGY
jgi:hypothetical protein